MTKLTVTSFHQDTGKPIARSVCKATPDDVAARVAHSMSRGGAKAVTAEVADADGKVVSTWDKQVDGTIINNEDVKEKVMQTQTETTTKPKSSKKEAAPKGPGVISTIKELLSRDGGVTHQEAVNELTKRFPDRDAHGMSKTVRIQFSRQKAVKSEDEKRGVVYAL